MLRCPPFALACLAVLSALVAISSADAKPRHLDSFKVLPNTEPAAATASARAPVCRSANPHGDYAFVAVLAHVAGVAPSMTRENFRALLAQVNGQLNAEAIESGSLGADLVFDCDGAGQIRVDEVAVPDDPLGVFGNLAALGYSKPNEKYVVWYDAPFGVYCGIADLFADDRAVPENASNAGAGETAVVYGCNALFHEIGHTLGAVQDSAPHSTLAGHCWDEDDVMCYADGGSGIPFFGLSWACVGQEHFDCLHDDYFDALIGAGSGAGAGTYLDTHWNIGACYVNFVVNQSCFASVPTPTPTPSPTPWQTPTPTPLPTETPTPPPTTVPITVAVSGRGRVTSSPPGIDCTATCTAEFPAGSQVVLAAKPSGLLLAWTGDCAAEREECTVTVDAPKTIDARFRE